MRKLLATFAASCILIGAICGFLVGHATAYVYIEPQERQALPAGLALIDAMQPYITGPVEAHAGWCRPVKRNRWRCRDTVYATLTDGTPIVCIAYIQVRVRSWRYPPEWFGCPPEWNPSTQ